MVLMEAVAILNCSPKFYQISRVDLEVMKVLTLQENIMGIIRMQTPSIIEIIALE